MSKFMTFSQNVKETFDGSEANYLQFSAVRTDAANRVVGQYSLEDANKMIRNQFDRVLGIQFKTASRMQRRQAWRAHSKEIASLIEVDIADKMNSGWNAGNAKFQELVEERNLSQGDTAEFYVSDNSLLQVSEFAGNHHNILRQSVKPGKSFTIDTSYYVIEVYADYELFQLGKIDYADLVDKMYKSIEQHRLGSLYSTTMTMDETLPTDMILATPVSEATKADILAHIEKVATVSGRDVILVGTRQAIQKLQSLVSYNMFSDAMKNEVNNKGVLANFEGYECLALERVNKNGTRESVFSADDMKKILIFPVDPEFKPIKRVNSGDVEYREEGMDGSKKDMTVSGSIRYEEGIGVVINQLFGEIKITV